MIIAGGLVGLLAVGGLAAVLLGGGDGDDDITTTASTVASTTTAPAVQSETTATTAAEETTDETTEPADVPASGGESIDDPLPLAGTNFVYEDFSGTVWSGTFIGVVDGVVSGDDPGACHLVLGTMTPDSIEEGNVTSGFDTPEIGAVADGIVLDRGFSDCERDAAEAAGYARIIDAELTEGSSYSFFSEIYVEGNNPPDLTAIVLGSATSDDARYYTVDRLDSIPQAPESVAATASGDVLPLAGATFTYTSFSDTSWEGEMLGLLPVDKGRFNEDDGSCFLIMGTITPTSIDGGFAASGFDAPDLGVIANGSFVDSGFSDCDEEPAQILGYRSIFNANVTTGTSYPFYAEIFVPADDVAGLSSVVLGNATDDDAISYSPDQITEAPPAVITVGDRIPDGLLPLTGSTFTYTSFSDTSWDGSLAGVVVVELESFVDATGTCYALIGTITPTEIDEGTATSGFDTPDFSVLTEGNNYGPSFGSCDRSALESAGYGRILDAEVTVGTAYPFVADFFVPGDGATLDAIVLGNATNDDAIYFEPTVLDSIPAP